MEWDMGTPWYRPTRVCHVVSGGEYGWRNGSGKWPAYFADSLPAVLNIGPSSPTGILHGTSARFPTKYRQAMFICDWSYGQIYALHLTPKGATYTATREVFCKGRPFAVVDAIIGHDGAMYMVTGGRNTQSAVWRIRYAGDADMTLPPPAKLSAEAKLRRQLETMHRPGEGTVAAVWPHLSHPDRFVRFAARIAVEHQPVAQWQSKVFSENDPTRVIHAAIALARHGDKALGAKLIGKLCSIDFTKLSVDDQLALLRALSLTQVRMGKSDTVGAYLLKTKFPDTDAVVTRELARLLIHAGEPSATAATVKLMTTVKDEHNFSDDAMLKQDQHKNYGNSVMAMKKAPPPTSQMYYALLLRNAKIGWTPELRQQYADWLTNAQNQVGGRSYKGFIQSIRKDAIAGLPPVETAMFAYQEKGDRLAALPQPKGPGRNWTIAEITKLADKPLRGRDFANGEKMYAAVLCASCHQMNGEGGAVGPDLTQLGTRFGYKDIAEAIIEPSKVISDQYDSKILKLKNGKSVVGRIVGDDKRYHKVSTNPFLPDTLEKVRKDEVESIDHSPVSLMPPALINRLNETELLDLLAYLTSGGDAKAKVFKK
jgi:putative heme-binding domain-containing protein